MQGRPPKNGPDQTASWAQGCPGFRLPAPSVASARSSYWNWASGPGIIAGLKELAPSRTWDCPEDVPPTLWQYVQWRRGGSRGLSQKTRYCRQVVSGQQPYPEGYQAFLEAQIYETAAAETALSPPPSSAAPSKARSRSPVVPLKMIRRSQQFRVPWCFCP